MGSSSDRRDAPVLRLAKVLKEQSEAVGSYSGLARRIAEENGNERGRAVDRRKLRRLADGEDVSLTMDELIALDAFLTPLGEGLADKPLFDRPAPIRSLVATGRVTIVLGAYARTDAQRSDLSRWDVRSMARLVRGIEKVKPGTNVEIEDVLFDKDVSVAQLEEPGRSVVSIGSPRICCATEVMLAKMFGVRAFDGPGSDRMPVGFLWSPSVLRPGPSAFADDFEEVRSLDADLAEEVEKGRTRAVLRAGERAFPDSSPGGTRKMRGKSYGVVVAQQQKDGRVWMVFAGLTGPVTDAAAAAVADGLTGPVPESGGGPSSIRWDVVEATIEMRQDLQGDPRVVTSAVVVDHGLWAPKVGRLE